VPFAPADRSCSTSPPACPYAAINVHAAAEARERNAVRPRHLQPADGLTWKVVKTDSEQHLERLEARLAQIRRANAAATAATADAANATASAQRSGRPRPPPARARPAPASDFIRPLTELDLLVLDGEPRRLPTHEGDTEDQVPMLPRPTGGNLDADEAEDDEVTADRVTRYAHLLTEFGRARRTSSSSSGGGGGGESSSSDDDEGSEAAGRAPAPAPAPAADGVAPDQGFVTEWPDDSAYVAVDDGQT